MADSENCKPAWPDLRVEGFGSAGVSLEAVRQFMEESVAFNRFLGFRLVHLAPGEATMSMPFFDHLVGDPVRPALHGGTISSLIDTAAGAAAFTCIEPGDKLSTLDLRVDYLRPAALVETLAEARVVRAGGRVSVARVQVFQQATAGNESREAAEGEVDGRRLVAEGVAVYAVRRATS